MASTIDAITLAQLGMSAIGPARNGVDWTYKQDVIDAAIAIQGIVDIDLPELLDATKFTGILRHVGEGTGSSNTGGNGVPNGRIALGIENTQSGKFSKAGEVDVHAGEWANSAAGKRMKAHADGLIGHRVLVFKKNESTEDGVNRKTLLRLVDLGRANQTASPDPELAAKPASKPATATAGPAPSSNDDDIRAQVPADGKAIVATAAEKLGLDRAAVKAVAEAHDLFTKDAMAAADSRAKLWELLCDEAASQVTAEAESALREPTDAAF